MNLDMNANAIIPLQSRPLDGEPVQTVNARHLHAFLEVGKDFSNWVKDRIEQHGFVEGQDFVSVEDLSSPNLASSKSRAQRIIEYHLTVEAAKHIAMAEHTTKGKEARDYFIQCEKDLRTRRAVDPCLEAGNTQDVLAARYIMAIKALRQAGHDALGAAIIAEQALADRGYNLAQLGVGTPQILGGKGPWQMLLSTIALTPVLVQRPFPGDLPDTAGDTLPQTTTVLDVVTTPFRRGRSALLQPVGLCSVSLKKVPYLVIPDSSHRFAKMVLKGSAWGRDGSWLETLADVPGVLLHQRSPGLYKAGAFAAGTWVSLSDLQQAIAWRKMDPRFPLDFPHCVQ